MTTKLQETGVNSASESLNRRCGDYSGNTTSSWGQGAKILLTGPPGIGKSTLMSWIVESMSCHQVRGVLCLEKRDGANRREGFSAVLSDGRHEMFMTKQKNPGEPNITNTATGKTGSNGTTEAACPVSSAVTTHRVGSYIVNVDIIDTFIVPELVGCLTNPYLPGLVYIDEIGRAQSHSSLFFPAVRRVLESDCNVLATIVQKNIDWSMPFKCSPKSWLVEVTVENREELRPVLLAMINNFSSFEKLSVSQQQCVRRLFFRLLEEKQFVSAKKLFGNAISYVVDSRIQQISDANDSSTSQTPSTSAFLILAEHEKAMIGYDWFCITGKTGRHQLHRDRRTGRFTCDCDLSLGRGAFSHLPARPPVMPVSAVQPPHVKDGGEGETVGSKNTSGNSSSSSSGRDGSWSARRGQTCSHELCVLIFEAS